MRKNKKLKIIIAVTILLIGLIPVITIYNLNNPTTLNKIIANKIYKEPVNKNFKDDNLYNCIIDAYNTQNNTSLPYTTNLTDEQLLTITNLSCNGPGKKDEEKITKADGIEKLTNLTFLSLGYNKLSTIDLSNNTNLKYLDLYNNNLSTIDLSNNVNLANLDLEYNNLTTIDLSNNVNLTELDLYYNNLTTIDLSSNVNLIELDFRYNYRFKEIVLPDNNKFDFSVISAQKAKIKYIKYGTTKVFEPVEEYDTYLNSKISVQTEEEINTFKTNLGLKNLTARIYNDEEEVTTGKIKDGYILKIYDGEKELGKLTIEVFEGISGFKDKNLYHCIIDAYNKKNNTSLEYTTGLTNEQLLTITSLSCNGYQKTDEEEITKADGIEKLTNLTKLNLGSNNLTTIDLSNNVNLTDLRLSNNNLSTIDLSKNINLKYLHLDNSNLSTIDLSKNLSLTQLSLGSNNLSTIDVSNNVNLTDLRLSNNNLRAIDLSNNTKLTILYLNNNNLRTIDSSNNVNLTQLSLGSNNLSTIDVSNNVNLTDLDLYNNNLSTIDVSKNVNLTELYLRYNNLSTIDVSNNVNLTNLDLHNNKLRTIDLNNNTKLETLDLSGNYLTKIDLSKNTKLTTIDISNNKFTLGNVYLKKDALIKETRNIKLPSKFPISYEIENTEIANYEEEKITGLKPGNTKIIATLNGVKESYSSNAKDMQVSGNIYVYDYTSEVYDLSKDYIYTGTNDFDKSKVVCTNCTTEVSNNKLIIKVNDEVVKEYKLVKISSTTYDLSKDYIYTGTSDFDKSKITCTNCNIEISNNNLLIKINDQILDQYNLSKISSTKYDLSKDDIYLNQNETIDKSKITCTNCNIEVSNNKLIIKVNDEVVKEYTIKYNAPTYKKGDINHDGKVNILDVGKLFSHVRGKSIIKDESLLKECDLNNDGKVNILDVGKLFSFVRGKTKSL